MDYEIHEITPAPWGENHRFVEAFETKKDAEKVLNALESVNISLNLYRIEYVG